MISVETQVQVMETMTGKRRKRRGKTLLLDDGC
jgi:hypothetical protein